MIIIPARLNSTRLKNKLLLPINGIPIIIRVANVAKEIDDTIVACDDNIIIDICKKNNINTILTSKLHKSGTDRCGEVVKKLHLNKNEIIINLQGDEPFIEYEVINKLKNVMKNNLKNTFMASCYKQIDKNAINDPNIVKVVLDYKSYAIYFSRNNIPYNRDDIEVKYYGHIGIYAFSAKSILEFCNLKKSALEDIEKLEQLRAIWHRKNILMVKVKSNSMGIDTIDDYNNALKIKI